MFSILATPFAGCYEVQPKVLSDSRGSFIKTFHHDEFKSLGLETNFQEEYYSNSHRNVVRGVHFQLPPEDHVKMVYCLDGEVFDVVVDLRVGSPTYKISASFSLSSKKANCLYIPKGMGHGFCVLSNSATLLYKVSTVYAPVYDSGVLWNSLDIEWPVNDVILSRRDSSFQMLSEFNSPFRYEKE